jgi:4-cresol dehydrogenase (hydroxylating)
MDPDRDGCGLLWCSPVAPMDGSHAQSLTSLASELVLRHGFEPSISLTMITERSLACIISISYDRDAPGEDEGALACHQNLLQALAARGYHSYRLGIASMAAAETPGAYLSLLRSIKQAVDPEGILAPGRYVSPPRTPAGGSRPAATRTRAGQNRPAADNEELLLPHAPDAAR